MHDDLTRLLALLAALFALWLVAASLVAAVATRIGELPRWRDGWLEPEAWLALAASGAAVGGFVSYGGAGAMGLFRGASAGSLLAFAPLVGITALGMIAGASLACGSAIGYLWARDEG